MHSESAALGELRLDRPITIWPKYDLGNYAMRITTSPFDPAAGPTDRGPVRGGSAHPMLLRLGGHQRQTLRHWKTQEKDEWDNQLYYNQCSGNVRFLEHFSALNITFLLESCKRLVMCAALELFTTVQ